MEAEEDSFVQLPCPSGPGTGCLGLTAEHIRQEIERCKELCSALEQEHVDLQTATGAVKQRTRELRKERERLYENFKQRKYLNREEEICLQDSILLAREMKTTLMQKHRMLSNILEDKRKKVFWKDPEMMLLPALPEKRMAFKGLVTNKDENKLMLTPLVHYPLQGGSALITFEKAEVAQRIIEAKEHTVELSCGEELEELDQCRVRVQAAPVDVLLPSALEIRLTQNTRSIILSDLPILDIPEEALLDKLVVFFGRKRNGGGEVESSELLDNSGQVVLTFAEDRVAELLIERGRIQVPLGKQTYELKISPCLSGEVSNLQLQPSRCPRTVLLSGIPDVLSEEPMRDILEIHFQKPSRGGGEVDSVGYVPLGRHGVAVFTGDAEQRPGD
ncbi:interferon-induced 35 kDa protein [Neopsephotus bourkii]|uniref:interferon-induced 35 kDa protein n=1 Tax=Neopsephotus bourkii TaxID=309878 RepID=UPI002AA5C0D6|nr:interferon-induced 35 kDa protein [Neopsephotus bourkii]